MSKKALSLSELLTSVKELIKEGLPDLYWVIAEIAEAKENQKGHLYLTLVQKQGDRLLAQTKANIWAYEYRNILDKFRSATGEGFKVGMKVMVLVSVEFHELYGMSLVIKDIEPSYTIGDMALKKKAIIERLKAEGLIDRNKSLSLPLVPQRIAIISSPQSAGYEDFVVTLTHNQYGYYFEHKLFASMMQGDEVKTNMIECLNKISACKDDFDLVVIIRGGGSSVDLSCFDDYEIANAVAQCPLPVITGIGHEKDDTVLDIVAHTRLKTPTAVAEFIISGMRAFEEQLIGAFKRVRDLTLEALNTHRQRLQSLSNRLTYSAKTNTTTAFNHLKVLDLRLRQSQRHLIELHLTKLTRFKQAVKHLSPENILQRGYSITYLNGKALKDASTAKNGDVIETRLKVGTLKSIIKNKTKGGKRKDAEYQYDLFSGTK